MNREDIIRMAREAGFVKVEDCCGVPNKFCASDEWKGNLAVFADLVASAEREECAKVCEKFAGNMTVLAEWGASQCANAIRARGQS